MDETSAWQLVGNTWQLAGGAEGLVEFPGWWSGNRPPRREMAVLEVEYRDSFTTPVHALVYSGMSTREGYSELHRFGGTGDGAWKKARIPCPADLMFLYLGNNTLRFKLIPKSNEPLEVRSCKLVAPAPGDEEGYNAETRAWVRRVQQRRVRVDSIYYRKTQTPVLEGKWAEKALVPFHRNYMILIEPVSAPQAEETLFPVTVKMSLNESEPFQLGVYANGQDLKNVTVFVDPVKGRDGKTAVETTVRVAEYSLVKNRVHSYFIEPFPQRLWPAYAFNLEKGNSHLVLLDFKTTNGQTKPGTYETTVRFSAVGVEEVEIPLRIEVLPYSLLTMEEAGLKLGGCTTGLIPEYEMELLHDYNHNMVNIWYSSVWPVLSKRGDSFEMDFRVMDDWMAAAKRAGFTDIVYFLGGNPPLFPRTMHLPRTLAECLYGIKGEAWRELSFRDAHHVPPQLVPHMIDWARRFGRNAKEKNWPNVILTPFDEPAKWVQYYTNSGSLPHIKGQFIQQIGLLRQGWPEVQIYGSIHHYYGGIDFLPYVDIFCTNAIAENWNLGEEVREARKIFWQYSGTPDKGLPGVARYTFGYYFADHNSRGSLVWAYNWGNRFDTIDGANWMYAWQTPFDLVPTPYLIGLREAWDDRRLRETLIQAANRKGVDLTNFLGRLSIEIATTRGRGGTSTLDDFWEKAKSDLVMEKWKERMVRKLLLIQQAE
ncbi:MAG: hypothetical protein U9P14_08295 [Gemmatimonadota bacterium]|nr:hypothetical protein [Gemmatimonadota bacterium]